MNESHTINDNDIRAMAAFRRAMLSPNAKYSSSYEIQRGWLTISEARDFSGLGEGFDFRESLMWLGELGFFDQKVTASIRHFRMTERGIKFLSDKMRDYGDDIEINSSEWTGIIDAVKVAQVLSIVSKMEDACEKIQNNFDRAQMFGLISALRALLEIPEPPRQGVLALIRDPAFSHIVNVGTFFAAIVAALKA